ncbi:hypothetical protein SVIO_032170 [Streptomyces violaceusniger]|uniref:Metalloprotease TldD/E C-terminal domain-containing protein n=1 Tax=Streptomyces violaceusniger TaxID=68280 RepID=A0A4D4KWP6_STRVO|nr:hypothetical protein SVIO_032170 [Streptomyces violaceusniger]
MADLLIDQLWSSSARDASEGRTVFSKPGGGTRVGEKLSELPFTLRSDPAEPGLETAPFVIAHSSGDDASVFDNGLPLSATDWIRDGVLQQLITTRHTSALTGLPLAPRSTTSSRTRAAPARWRRWSRRPSAGCC